MKTNYFFALFSWIANAGVVPLLRLAAFLFAPPFFVLFVRRVSVTLVFDTIYQLLKSVRLRFLPIHAQYVKILLALIITLPSFAQEQSLIISKGEHKELSFAQMASYSISNKDVVAHKMSKRSKKILIKGKKLGYSELIVWHNDGKHTVIQIYVLSKNKQLAILHLAQTLRSLGLQTSTAGPMITVTGTLEGLENFLLLKRLEKNNSQYLHIRVVLSKNLQKEIIGEVYELLFDEYIDNISCQARNTSVVCQYPLSNPPSKKLIDYLEKKFFIDLVPIQNLHTIKNYQVSMKMILIEKSDGKEIDWGLSKLKSNLGDIFDKGVISLVENNQVFLQENHINLSSLAEPQLLLTVGKKAMIQVGADLPYQQGISGSDQLTTSWKFAGLKIDFELSKIGKTLQIDYQSEFTRPTTEGISGSKQKSLFTLNSNTPVQAFEIGFKTDAIAKSSIPVIGKIPILGRLFNSTSSQVNYKKIIGIIKLTPYEQQN